MIDPLFIRVHLLRQRNKCLYRRRRPCAGYKPIMKTALDMQWTRDERIKILWLMKRLVLSVTDKLYSSKVYSVMPYCLIQK